MKCQCKELLKLNTDKVYYHCYGCPESEEYKEYQNLKWYQKIFKENPLNQYLDHLKPSLIVNKGFGYVN